MGELVVEARAVDKTYGKGHSSVRVLRGLDLRLSAGEFCVVLGPSGSGKSTLLNMLGLMDRPDKGEIFFSGRETSRMDEDARSAVRGERLGFIFQFDSLLPEFTMLENVLMPWRIARARGASKLEESAAQARALELLRGLGLERPRDRFPSQASGGERQRVAICRALINHPTVLLADEPTGNLDKTNGEMVFSDLKSLAEKHSVAVVMVTHNESACGYAHRTLTMQDGAIVEEVRKK